MNPRILELFTLFQQLKVLKADLGQAGRPEQLGPFVEHFLRILTKAAALLGDFPGVVGAVAHLERYQNPGISSGSRNREAEPLPAVTREALQCDMGSLLAALESCLHLACTEDEKKRIGFAP